MANHFVTATLDYSHLENVTDIDTLLGQWHLFKKAHLSMASHGVLDTDMSKAADWVETRILDLEPLTTGRLAFLELELMLSVGHELGETAPSCLLCILVGASGT